MTLNRARCFWISANDMCRLFTNECIYRTTFATNPSINSIISIRVCLQFLTQRWCKLTHISNYCIQRWHWFVVRCQLVRVRTRVSPVSIVLFSIIITAQALQSVNNVEIKSPRCARTPWMSEIYVWMRMCWPNLCPVLESRQDEIDFRSIFLFKYLLFIFYGYMRILWTQYQTGHSRFGMVFAHDMCLYTKSMYGTSFRTKNRFWHWTVQWGQHQQNAWEIHIHIWMYVSRVQKRHRGEWTWNAIDAYDITVMKRHSWHWA